MNDAIQLSGRKRFIIALLTVLLLLLGNAGEAAAQNSSSVNNDKAGQPMNLKNSKILITFFSHSGNTRNVAEQLQKTVGGDLFEITTVDAYPEEYRPTTEKARRELDENHRPALAAKVENMAAYDLIFLGYPNWWGTMPMALFTFLEQYDLSGKTIAPFCTHEGSRLGRSVEDLSRLAPRSTVLNGFEIRGGRADQAGDGLAAWLRGLGLLDYN